MDYKQDSYDKVLLLVTGPQAASEVVVVGVGQQRVGGDQRDGVVQFGGVAVPQLGV
jgi:hypothetical protein